MKKLNKRSAKFFCSIVDRMESSILKINNEPFSPLYVRHIGEAYVHNRGIGMLYSLCQFAIHYGDIRMKEPEMCFIFLDDRRQKTDYTAISVIPYRYVFRVFGTYETSMTIRDSRIKRIDNEKQARHVTYANKWLRLLRSQGY